MIDITVDDVYAVYAQLKDRYALVLTTTAALDEGFAVDCPIIVGKAHGQIIELYEDSGMFILDVMDAAQTMGTHWHPDDVDDAVDYIVEFMEGKTDYDLYPFEHMEKNSDNCSTFETIACLTREKTVHNMKLNPQPFEMIKNGQKTIELRLFDEKRRQIKAGDVIVFTNTATGETLTATVSKLHCFDSFDELYQALPLLQCGYTTENVDQATPADMQQYYSMEEQKKYGVVGIELFPPK